MEKQFNVCVMVSGCLDISVKAESEEEAIEMAQDELRWASPSDYEGVYESENDVEIDDVEEV